ncbi:MAG: hypothetical protein IKN96_00580 [Oscillibacter sp.]|nr:hypothetical protein [Oscillibacter sp.]
MAYSERDFLNGLAAGLAATGGRLIAGGTILLTGTGRMIGALPEGDFDAFVSRVAIVAPSPGAILYEYGANGETPSREFRRVAASEETQTFYHVARTARGFSLRDFSYAAYLTYYGGGAGEIRFDARFMSFPYYHSGESYLYPGSPEQVDVWWVRTSQ